MMNTNKKTPKLRFKGFVDDWGQRKLGSIGSTYTGLSGKTKEDFGHGEAQYITYLNIFLNTVSDITMTDKVEIDTTQNEVKYGDVLFTTSSETPEEVGMSSVWMGDSPNTYLNSFCFGFRPNQKINPYFLGYSLRAPYMRDKIKILAQGISRYNISKNKVMELEISLPNNEEQKLLGTFLQRIDLIITLHQRKLEQLNLKKKALLQKLFPKNGECYPELRFPGFTDAWEQRKLGDFTNQINTFVNPEDAKLPLWSLTAEAGLIEKSDRYERDFLVKKKDQFKRIETNTLVYNPMNITIGSIDIYTGLYPIAVSGYYVSIVYDKNIDTDFLKEVLLLPSSLKMYKNYATGSLIERQRVQYPTFSKLQLLLPNLDEQKAIGQIFKSLNLNITLHQRKLDHLQLQKKALLQQMFV